MSGLTDPTPAPAARRVLDACGPGGAMDPPGASSGGFGPVVSPPVADAAGFGDAEAPPDAEAGGFGGLEKGDPVSGGTGGPAGELSGWPGIPG